MAPGSDKGGAVHSVLVDGVRIAYRSAGAGPPLLLLHGGMLDSRSWQRQLAGWSDRWRVVAWDAPGCGGSDDAPDDWDLEGFARCLIGFCRALGLERPHLVGLSFGAGLTLAVQRVDPSFARSLVLVSGYAGWAGSLPPEEVAARLAAVRDAVEHPRPPLLEDGLPFTAVDPAPEVLEELLAQARSARPENALVAARAFADADLRAVLPGIAVPVLVVHGAEDRRAPRPVAEALAAAIPTASLVVLPGVGHVLNQEDAPALDAAVRPFLLRAEREPARR
jgi:pimeloyl-ACP methyl ester carboxylesterase